MIGSLRGTLGERAPAQGEVLVEVGGVGYRVVVTPQTGQRLGRVGAEVHLHVHHHFREDHQALYGFVSREERDCFEALIGAHGVGPTLALAILATHEPAALARILTEDDLTALCLVPGVGKKTAARLIVELKARLDVGLIESSLGGSTSAAALDQTPRGVVRQALAELGYNGEEIRVATADLPDSGDEAMLLRQALGRLAR